MPAGGAQEDEEESDSESSAEPDPSANAPDAGDAETRADQPSPAQEGGQQPLRFAPELADEEVERWLDEVQDGTGAALRAAADPATPARRRTPPAW